MVSELLPKQSVGSVKNALTDRVVCTSPREVMEQWAESTKATELTGGAHTGRRVILRNMCHYCDMGPKK